MCAPLLASCLPRSFSYDPEDRLQTYQDNLGSQTYRYDPTGNRTGIDYGATSYLYTVATTSNRLTKVVGPVVKTYLYDAAGNPTSDSVITFTWDAANRLNKIASGKGSSAVSASYLYNGFGQRLLKTANVLTNAPWRYVYDEAGHLIGEYDKNNAARQETVWLGDTPVAVVKQTAPNTQSIYYIQTDHLNTPRVILNSTNTPVWRWDNSDAFGVGLPDEDPDKDTVKFEYNPRFPGQYFDKETNLHYNGFRDYEPRTGRYPAADPIGLDGGDNVYGYGLNNPISFTDPTGLNPFTAARVGYAVGQSINAALNYGLIAATGLTLGELIYEAVNSSNNFGPMFNKSPENANDPDGPKAPGKPGEAQGFKDPKGGEKWVPNPNPGRGGSSHGWEDSKGNVWCPTGQRPGRAHGGPGWDVQIPGGDYKNIFPKKK